MTKSPTILRRQPGLPLDATLEAMEEQILQLLPIDHGFVLLLTGGGDIAMSSNYPPSTSRLILRELIAAFDGGLDAETAKEH